MNRDQASAQVSRPAREQPQASQQASGAAPAATVEHGVLIQSDRDRRTLAWLVAQAGAPAVEVAAARLAGGRKAFPSNVAKVLGLAPPRALALTTQIDGRAKLAAMRAKLPAGTFGAGLRVSSKG